MTEARFVMCLMSNTFIEYLFTGLTHILITAGISPAIVFSKIYEPTRIKYVRMMYDQIARRRFANKMSDPSIDNR